MKKYIITVLILVVLGAGGAYLYIKKDRVPIISTAIEHITETDEPKVLDESKVVFKNYGPAPELSGISKWYNTPNNSPVSMGNLKGKVVVVNFWTYSSINSTRAIPSLQKWQRDYEANGLQIITVHTPQYAFEKVTGNLENAIKSQGVNVPIAVDNDYKTWTAYHNQFWPALYLIDREGNIVYTHYGDGDYDQKEKAVRTVLGLEGEFTTPPLAEQNQSNTPDITLGFAKQNGFANSEKPSPDTQIYSFPKKLGDNQFALEGQWAFSQEAAIHTNGFGRIKLNFDAAKVNLVAESKNPMTIRVYVDGALVKGVVVGENQLYELYNSIAGGKHTMEIEIPDGGFLGFKFTFG